MQLKDSKENKERKNNTYLTIVMAVLVVLIIIPLAFDRADWAQSGNYNKTELPPDNTLLFSEWNNLPQDFLAKSGGTMSGQLEMSQDKITNVAGPTASTDLANKQYTDQAIAEKTPVKNLSGQPLRVLCGKTTQGSTDWKDYSGWPNSVYLVINFPSDFAAVPYYFTSLGGINGHHKASGVTSIYNPQLNSLVVYVIYNGDLTAATAKNVYQWYVNWCAYGIKKIQP